MGELMAPDPYNPLRYDCCDIALGDAVDAFPLTNASWRLLMAEHVKTTAKIEANTAPMPITTARPEAIATTIVLSRLSLFAVDARTPELVSVEPFIRCSSMLPLEAVVKRKSSLRSGLPLRPEKTRKLAVMSVFGNSAYHVDWLPRLGLYARLLIHAKDHLFMYEPSGSRTRPARRLYVRVRSALNHPYARLRRQVLITSLTL